MPDIKFMCVSAQLSGGSPQSITHATETWTPTAAVVWWSPKTGVDGAETAQNDGSVGFTDGTTHCAFGWNHDDNKTSASTNRGSGSGVIIQDRNGGKTAGMSGFVAGGISIDPNFMDGRAVCWLFGGTDLEADVNFDETVTNNEDYTGAGFKPDLCFLASICDNANDSTHKAAFGFTDGTTHRGTSRYVVGGTVAVQSMLDTSYCIGDRSTSSWTWRAAVDGFDANGYTWHVTGTPGTDDIGCLALRFGGQSVKVESIDSPDATGDWAHTGVGFQPLMFGLIATSHDSEDVVESDGTGGGWSANCGDANGDMFAIGWHDQDNVTTSRAKCTADDEALLLYNHAGSLLYQQGTAAVSMDSDGWTIEDLTTASATTHKFIGFAIEDPDAGGGGSVPVLLDGGMFRGGFSTMGGGL